MTQHEPWCATLTTLLLAMPPKPADCNCRKHEKGSAMPVKHFELMKEYLKDCEVHEKPWELWEHRLEGHQWSKLEWHPTWRPGFEYRRKPKTITINGIEVPAPMGRTPEKGSLYYGFTVTGGTYVSFWNCDNCDKVRFKFGIWPTEQDAAQVGSAIMKALRP